MKASSPYLSDLAAGILDRTPLPNSHGVTLAYVGTADAVDVVVMEDRFPAVGRMRRVDDSDAWFVDIPLDADGSIEYKLAVTKQGKRRLILDPKNPDHTSAPFGPNSVAAGISYSEPQWLDEQTPHGTVHPFPVQSKVWGRPKSHKVYIPNGHDDGSALPLLIMHDGPEYMEYAGLSRCLDFLIAGGHIPPLIVLLHQPHARNAEYVDNPLHFEHLFEEALPLLAEIHPFNALYAGGASLGGVAALLASFHNPDVFAGLVLQSGSFVFELGGPFKRGSVLRPVTQILPKVLQHHDKLPNQLVFSCGTYDGLVEDHRILIPQLQAVHPGTKYAEINAGHHWRCWRDRLEYDLLALFESP